jgi:8-oxo-dGTP pyrophosphatase MutT (NUDIX family)
MNNINKIIYCGNCGKSGHTYRRCLAPIISLGIILFKIENKKLKYLLIQRKDTLGFVEFMRGKYNLENIDYIKELLKIMTLYEREKIINNDFDHLWNELWMNFNSKKFFNEYSTSKEKFIKLKEGFMIQNKYYNIKTINDSVKDNYIETEWGFPKGRRNLREYDIDCAKREFEEESGYKNEDYEIINEEITFDEIFSGTNNIRYQHTYYLAKSLNEITLKIDKNNFNQYSEIKKVKWFNFEDGFEIIRDYNIEKKNILNKVDEYIKINILK